MRAVNNPHRLATHEIEPDDSLIVAVNRQTKSNDQERKKIFHAQTVAQRMVVATKAMRLWAFLAQGFALVVPQAKTQHAS